MRENRFFIKSTDLAGLVAVSAEGGPANAHYERIIEEIERLCGRDAASLFSEPVHPRAGGESQAVSWYGRREGAVAELIGFDEVARKPLLERLRQRLEALRPALQDPHIGAIVRAWLHLSSARDVLAVAGEPIFVNWGYVPAAAAASPQALRTQIEDTLGRLVPLAALGLDAPEAASASLPQVAAPPPAPAWAAPPPPPPPPPPWRAPLIACAIAGLALLLALLPGVLVYPRTFDNSARDAFELDRLKASNKSLEAQIAALDAAVKGKACVAPGETAPAPGLNDGDAPPRMELAPRPPEKTELSPGGEGAAKNVAELLEKSVVMVFALTDKGGATQGSGFFISDRQIVTNHHVVEGANPDLVFVAGRQIGGIRHARIVAKTMPPPVGNDMRPDFAVVEIDAAAGATPLKLGVTPPKLSTAYVAGFPAFLTERDAAFGDFLEKLKKSFVNGKLDEAKLNQETSVPGADLRYGRVNNVMASGSQRLQAIIHDMQLAPGNSGGPLVDACGRVGGVNTLLFPADSDERGSAATQQGNVALDVGLLRAFLSAQHIAFTAEDGACVPTQKDQPPAGAPPTAERR